MGLKIKKSSKPFKMENASKQTTIYIILKQSSGKKQYQYCHLLFLINVKIPSTLETFYKDKYEIKINTKKITFITLEETFLNTKDYQEYKSKKQIISTPWLFYDSIHKGNIWEKLLFSKTLLKNKENLTKEYTINNVGITCNRLFRYFI